MRRSPDRERKDEWSQAEWDQYYMEEQGPLREKWLSGDMEAKKATRYPY